VSDQASIRIIVQDEGAIAPSNAQSPSRSAPNPNPYAPQYSGQSVAATPHSSPQSVRSQFDAVEEAKKRLEADRRRALVDAEYAKLNPPPASPTFNPVEEAKKRLDADKKRAAIDAEYEKLNPTPPTPSFDPVEEAKKRLDADKKRAAIDAEYEKLNPTAKEVFDPALEARKRIEAEDRKKEIESEYEKLRPSAPEKKFDPVEEAKKQREAEINREMVKATYDRLYDTAHKTESALDAMLDVSLKLRGTLGGAFGGLIGTALDAYAMYKDKQKSSVRIEAERRLGFASGGEIPPAPGVPLGADEVPIKATAGEFIVNRAAAQVPENRAILEDMNARTVSVPENVSGLPMDLTVKTNPSLDEHARDIKNSSSFSKYEHGKGIIDLRGNVYTWQNHEKANRETTGLIHHEEVAEKLGLEYGTWAPLIYEHDPESDVGVKATTDVKGYAKQENRKRLESHLNKLPYYVGGMEHCASGGMVGHYATGGSVASGPPPATPYRGRTPPDVSEKEYPSIKKEPAAKSDSGAADALMAVAPEIRIALKIGQAVQDAIVGGIRGVGNTINAAINPDPNAAKSVEAMGDALGVLNPILGETVSAFGRLMGTIDGMASRYGEFSPEIAQAQGMAEVRQTMGDLRRAQEAGPELARYIQMQTELQQKFEDIKIKVLLKILPIVELVGTLLGEAVSAGADVTSAIVAIATPLNQLVAVARFISGTMEDANREEPQDPTNLIINLQTGVNGPGLNLPPPT